MSTASRITTLTYTMVDFYLLMVLTFSMSTANRISMPIHTMVAFQLLMVLEMV